ncbi:hypothetical protein BD626DRAFT_562713 [Schizophyllum amplum]|uniref:F-box domain-containing protein n=1 Tax=Schizophyllum amplum TaxID=97359 RepID=A0A550CVS3_9AGAR|nr:hypothetical protein BD626DRAFT_562713 [Auriculariopsis ampla]
MSPHLGAPASANDHFTCSDSALAGCLTRNEVPDATQKVAIRRILNDGDGRVLSLNQQIDDLIKQRAELVEKLDLYRLALVSPMRALPYDILAEIMRLSIGPQAWRRGRAPPHAIMALMHVCSGWRAVASGHAQLWTSLCIYGNRASSPDAIRQIHAWFKRARPMTVSLYIDPRSHLTRHLLKDDLGLLTHQISALSVHCPIDMLADFLHLPPGAFPALEKLDLSLGSGSAVLPPHTRHGLSIFKEARLLRSLHLSGINNLRTGALSTEMPIDWARLEELELRQPTDRHDIPRLFRQCTSLRRAFIDLTNVSAAQSVPSLIVDFPSLALLDISFEVWPAALMDASHFRHLTQLAFSSAVRLTETNLSRLGPHVPQLEKILLRDVDLFDWENKLDTFLADLHCLREIVFCDATLSPRSIMPVFSNRAACGGGMLVPHLERLIFDNIDIGAEDEDLRNYTDAFGLAVDVLGIRLENTPLCEFQLTWSWRYKHESIPLYGHAKYSVRLLQDLIDAYPALYADVEDLRIFTERIQTGAYGAPGQREDYAAA